MLNEDRLAAIDQKVLITQGDKDALVDLEASIAVYRKLKNANFKLRPKTFNLQCAICNFQFAIASDREHANRLRHQPVSAAQPELYPAGDRGPGEARPAHRALHPPPMGWKPRGRRRSRRGP